MTQRQRVMKFFEEQPRGARFTACQIANATGVKRSSLSSLLVKMCDGDLLDRRAEGAPTHLEFGRYRSGWLYFRPEA